MTTATMVNPILSPAVGDPCGVHQENFNHHVAHVHAALQHAMQQIEAAQYALHHSQVGMSDGPTMRTCEDVQRHIADTQLQLAYLPATARTERAGAATTLSPAGRSTPVQAERTV